MFVLGLTIACGGEPAPRAVPSSPDSAAVAPMAPVGVPVEFTLVERVEPPDREGLTGSLFVARLEMRRGTRLDTLRELWVTEGPQVVNDTLALGFSASESGFSHRIYRIVLATGAVEFSPLPDDFDAVLSDATFCSTGRLLAYVGVTGDSEARGIIREWPTGAATAVTPSVRVPPGDTQLGFTKWDDCAAWTILIDGVTDSSGRWLRFRGRAGSAAEQVDTVSSAVLSAR